VGDAIYWNEDPRIAGHVTEAPAIVNGVAEPRLLRALVLKPRGDVYEEWEVLGIPSLFTLIGPQAASSKS